MPPFAPGSFFGSCCSAAGFSSDIVSSNHDYSVIRKVKPCAIGRFCEIFRAGLKEEYLAQNKHESSCSGEVLVANINHMRQGIKIPNQEYSATQHHAAHKNGFQIRSRIRQSTSQNKTEAAQPPSRLISSYDYRFRFTVSWRISSVVVMILAFD